MHSTQQVVKTLAIAFAIVLISGIVSSLFFVGWTIGNLTELWRGEETVVSRDEVRDQIVVHSYQNVKELEIDVDYGELEIRVGDELKVATNNSDLITYKHVGNKLEVSEIGHDFFTNHAAMQVVVYVPDDLDLDKVKIETGAGRATISGLTAKRMELDLGASKTELRNTVVTDKMEINGGAGVLEIVDSVLTNFDFDMGVGRADITAELLGSTKIDAGVGALRLDLQGDEETTYGVEVERGLGAVTINGEKRSSDVVLYGTRGGNLVKISGGVGSIEINLRAE